jgi:hypothetical protein
MTGCVPQYGPQPGVLAAKSPQVLGTDASLILILQRWSFGDCNKMSEFVHGRGLQSPARIPVIVTAALHVRLLTLTAPGM